MPDEPNRNIEEQVKAWAQQRREEAGAPIELRPATRKLLQDEVARTHPTQPTKDEERDARASWVAVLWPRLVWALPVVFALVVSATLLLPALSKSKSKGRRAVELAQQDKKASLEEYSQARGQSAEKFGESVSLRDELAKAPAVSSTPAPTVPPTAGVPMEANERLYAEAKNSLGGKLEARREPVAELDARKDAELALEEKAKVGTPPLAQAPRANRGLGADNLQSKSTRQRYGLSPTPPAKGDENVERRALSSGAKRESETRTVAREVAGGRSISETQVALDQTTRGRGFDGGATANKPVPGGGPAVSAEQTAATDNVALALKRADDRAAAIPTVSLGASAQTGRLEAAKLFAFFGRPDGQLTQRFAQAQNYRRNLNSPPMPNVLNSFQLEQNGQQIRIVDADGSTYEGQIEGPQTESVLREKFSDATVAEELSKRQVGEALRRQNRALQSDGATIAGQNVWFRAAGTNRTLNQPVLFLGNLSITDTNAPNANAVNGIRAGVTLAPQSAAFPAQNQLQFQNSRIQGQATIGVSNRIEINAVPAAP